MKLYNLVKAKTGYISPELYKEALLVAKKDVQAHRAIGCEFDTWSKAQQLEYIAYTMAVYVIVEGRTKHE
jgi:hypothetical protein